MLLMHQSRYLPNTGNNNVLWVLEHMKMAHANVLSHHLIYKSKHGVCLWRQKQDEVLKRARSSKPSRTWTEVSVCLSRQTAQGRGRAGKGRGSIGQGRGSGRAGQDSPESFFFFFCIDQDYLFFSFSYCPSWLRGRMKCPSVLMTGRI
jgi:hypothetical protein